MEKSLYRFGTWHRIGQPIESRGRGVVTDTYRQYMQGRMSSVRTLAVPRCRDHLRPPVLQLFLKLCGAFARCRELLLEFATRRSPRPIAVDGRKKDALIRGTNVDHRARFLLKTNHELASMIFEMRKFFC